MSDLISPKPRIFESKVKIAIVASKYNETYTDALVEHATKELKELMPKANVKLIRVPGAFEIPATAAKLIDHHKFDCVIALGLLIDGETDHANLVASSVTDQLQRLSVDHRTPIIHGVLLVDNEEQARVRCISEEKNRGLEAARAATSIVAKFSEIEKSFPKKLNQKSN